MAAPALPREGGDPLPFIHGVGAGWAQMYARFPVTCISEPKYDKISGDIVWLAGELELEVEAEVEA